MRSQRCTPWWDLAALVLVVGGCLSAASLAGAAASTDTPVAPPGLSALAPPTLPLTPGATGTLTATLSAAPTEALTLDLQSGDPTIATLPATVTVRPGALAVGIPVTGMSPGSTTVTATLAGRSLQSTVTVAAAGPALTGLVPSSLTIVQGASGVVTVTIGTTQATDTTVALSVSDARLVGLPPAGTVTIPAGQRDQAFAIFGGSPGAATLTATLAGTTLQTQVTVTTRLPAVVSLRPPVLPLVQGSTGTLTVTLDASQPTETAVLLVTSDATVVGLPADRVTVPAHTLSASLPVTGLGRGTATVTAALGGTSVTAAISVEPPPPTLTGLTCPAALTAGTTSHCTLILNATQPTDTDVSLEGTDAGVLQLPASVTIPANTFTVTFGVTGSSLGGATITAGPLHGTTQTATLQVLLPPPMIGSLAPSTPSLAVGATATLALTLNAAQPTDTLVSLTAAPPGLIALPVTLAVPAGALTGTVPLVGLAPGAATLTAGPLNGSQAQANLTVGLEAPTVTGLTPPALDFPQGTAEPLTVTIAPAQPGPTVVPLTSSDPGRVEVPPSVPVPAGDTTAPVPVVGRAPGTATVTAGPLQGSTQQATVTVRPPALRTLAVLPALMNLPQGQTQAFAATGTYTDGSTQDVTSTVTWDSSEPTLAAITAEGRATGLAVGYVTLTATLGARTATASLTVTAPIPSDLATATGSSAAGDIPLLAGDVGLTVAPADATVLAGGEAHYALTVSSLASFTGLVSLTASGLPGGATALVSPQALGPNQSGTLTIRTTAGLAPGRYALSLTGTTVARGRTVSLQQGLTLTVLAGGRPALTGRILDTQRRPLAGVTLRLLTTGGQSFQTVTDAAGSFLLTDPPPGDQLLLVDGETASTAGAKYPTIPVTVTIRPDGVTPLYYTPHLHAQKNRNFTRIHPTLDTVATDPELPGVTLRIPAGAKIIGWDGQPNTQVSIHTVPIDRLPVAPVPAEAGGGTVYMFYFGKRGGGVASQPIPFEAPNEFGLKPGEKADLWYFDESPVPGVGPNAWRKAGTGTVTADGKRIRTDPGVGIPKFCCGATKWNPSRPNPQTKVPAPTPERGKGKCCVDPVDASTGIFMLTATDLALPGRIPVTLTRTYRSGDSVPGPFGIGTTMAHDDYLADGMGSVITYVYAANAATPFTWQSDGSYINTTTPAFRGARITGQPGARVLQYKDGRAVTFDGSGAQIGERDRVGNAVVIERTDDTNATVIHEPSGRALTVAWGSTPTRDHALSAQDPLGRIVQYGYDGDNRLATVTDPAGGITRYTYDTQHRMTSVTNPRGITVVQNTYDGNSRVCEQLHGDSGLFRLFYVTTDRATLPESLQLLAEAAAGGPITQAPCSAATASLAAVTATVVVDARGKPTTYRFDGQGFLTQETDALGQVTTYTRQADTNLLLSVTDPLARVTGYQYDANGNVTQITPPVTDPLTPPRTFTYDATFNAVTSATDPLGNLSTFEYDGQGNLTAITDPEQNLRPEAERLKTRMTYTTTGQVLTVADPLNQTTTFTYTGQGDVETVTDPLGATTTRTYDGISRLATQTDALGRTSQFIYDALNQVSAIVDPLGRQTGFTYDSNGNLLTVRDPQGSTTTHEYDPRDRLSRRIDPLGKAETFGYDGNGNLTTTTDRKNQTTTFLYDALNRRTQASYQDGSVATFSYDAGNRLTQVDDTADPHRPITATYDPLDRLLTETTSLGVVTYAYDAAGRRASLALSGQTPVSYTYDANARLRTITQAPLNPVTLDYDAANRRTLLTLPNGVSTEYQYDLASRLTALLYRNALGPLGDLTYTYDAAGNRIAAGGAFARTLVPDAMATSSYDAGNRQLAFGASTLTFDDNGNRLTQTDPSGTITSTWDARNRLTGLTGPGLSASFAYDGLGRRAQKTLGSATTDFWYDGLDVVRESSEGADVTYLRTLGIDEVLARTDAVETVHYLADALGSSVALTTAAGTLATSYTYEPFGRTEVSGSPSANGVHFTGRENDGTGLYYYRARYYDPARSRFLSEDPIRFRGGINFYSYVSNSPAVFVDPWGLDETIWDFGGNGRWGPRNGNWGGKDWSGGWVPSQHDDQAGPRAPTDSADECYMAHDQCYERIAPACNPSEKNQALKDCNRQLVKCLRKLPDNPKQWPHPPRPGTEPDSSSFRWGAINGFEKGIF